MTHINDVTMTVRTDDGAAFTLTVSKPEPWGDNPIHLTRQLATAVEELHTRHAAIIRTEHGKQIGDES
jgi:hypothetical protein